MKKFLVVITLALCSSLHAGQCLRKPINADEILAKTEKLKQYADLPFEEIKAKSKDILQLIIRLHQLIRRPTINRKLLIQTRQAINEVKHTISQKEKDAHASVR